MFKQIAKGAWERVVLSYKSTAIGVGIGVACIIIDQFALAAESSGRPFLQALAAIATVVGASLKSKAL